jgi:hypothetical protein
MNVASLVVALAAIVISAAGLVYAKRSARSAQEAADAADRSAAAAENSLDIERRRRHKERRPKLSGKVSSPDGGDSYELMIMLDAESCSLTALEVAIRPEQGVSNPPFGARSSIRVVRDDFWVSTSNKELNFLQHVANILRMGGRAAIVVPDGVLTGSGAGAAVRRRLLRQFNVHTLLRLPTGLFYAQGINANVLFFDRPVSGASRTDESLWVYDLRTGKRFTLMGNRFGYDDVSEFVELYRADDRSTRQAT